MITNFSKPRSYCKNQNWWETTLNKNIKAELNIFRRKHLSYYSKTMFSAQKIDHWWETTHFIIRNNKTGQYCVWFHFKIIYMSIYICHKTMRNFHTKSLWFLKCYVLHVLKFFFFFFFFFYLIVFCYGKNNSQNCRMLIKIYPAIWQ